MFHRESLVRRFESAWPTASLRTYMVAVILLATLPMAAFMSYQVLADLGSERAQTQEELARSAAALAQTVERVTGERRRRRLMGENLREGRTLDRNGLVRPAGRCALRRLHRLDAGGRDDRGIGDCGGHGRGWRVGPVRRPRSGGSR